jgi:neutral ceramidase
MNRLNRVVRIIGITFLVISGLLILLIAVAIGPVNREPVSELPLYNQMLQRIDSASIAKPDSAKGTFKSGFSKVTLVPDHPTATAGYSKRRGKHFTAVHDSIFVRTLVLENGVNKVAIVTADLLIIPPTVTAVLARKLPEIGFSINNTYLGATHTHNSIGNWAKGAAGFIYGDYDESVVNFIADAIIKSISQASSMTKPSTIKTGKVSVPESVTNRLINNGPEDAMLRIMEITRSDSSKMLFTSFTAHATCLFSRDMELSADYPGKLVYLLEQEYDFAMFMAGAVGSHKCEVRASGWACIDEMAQKLSEEVLKSRTSLQAVKGKELLMLRMPLLLPEPQVKISEDWKVRAWLFRKALHEYPASLTGLKIGNLMMLGAPCDFSGEFDFHLDSLAANAGEQLIVTSFNGGYIGYATPAKYFDVDHYETRLMNWYPPGNGDYISECFSRMITAMATQP